ncbi:hypothetical protein [Sinomonas mesophila]|uniref:hypothetical protein n=1 Tax=Sinomonas mesophila TaxID=1531955 RepID=UPI000984E7AC|nr:hypothetical protein [Sinomonas mesophila]
MSKEPTEVLYLSVIVGGITPEGRRWQEAIRQLRQELAPLREGVVSDVNLDVEFHIPGNLLAPDFDGVRTGAFRKADSLLKVQAALPATAPAEPRPALIRYLWDALDAADAWAVAKRQAVDTTALRGIVAAVEASHG